MLDADSRKFALEDARTHHAAQLELIKAHDQKAMSLLSLYVTLGIATVGLALTTLSSEPLVPTSAAVGLASASWSLFVGAMFCFRTIERSSIDLPGRGYEFWEIAFFQPGDSFERATRTYLLDGIEQSRALRDLNIRLANRMREAKRSGIAAPVVAAISGVATEIFLRLSSS